MNTNDNQIVELQHDQIDAVAGGFDDIPYCGTPWRRIPLPGPILTIPPVVLTPRGI